VLNNRFFNSSFFTTRNTKKAQSTPRK